MPALMMVDWISIASFLVLVGIEIIARVRSIVTSNALAMLFVPSAYVF